MNDSKYNIYALDQELLATGASLVPIGLKISVVEDGATVVWLGGRHQYLSEEADDTCMNGKYVQLNSVCWFEMYGYHFPPVDSNFRLVPPGSYYFIQRIQTHGRRPYFPEKIHFELKACSADGEETILDTTFLFDIQRLQGINPGWNCFAVGYFQIDKPCKIKLRLHAIQTSWKNGFCWDYFELMAVKYPPHTLKYCCSSVILQHLKEKEEISINKLDLPGVLARHLTNLITNPRRTLCLFNIREHRREYRQPRQPQLPMMAQGNLQEMWDRFLGGANLPDQILPFGGPR